MVSVSAWEAIFMLVVLKLPMVYLAVVVWWAIRAEPHSPAGGADGRDLAPLTPCGWDDWKRSRRRFSRPLRPVPSRFGPRLPGRRVGAHA
jgi:hypothetical protein